MDDQKPQPVVDDQKPQPPRPSVQVSHHFSISSSAAPTTPPTPIPTSASQHAAVRYRGTRRRGRKWVSEIREPGKTKRIWLGTYPTAEMAAAAFDVASLALRGPNIRLNFPNSILSYPIPRSLSPADISAAARTAAQARNFETGSGSSSAPLQYIDEDELFNMTNLLDDMARGMQVSPPRIPSFSYDDDDSTGYLYIGDNLWSF